MPAYDRHQQCRQRRSDQRADRPAALDQTVDESLAAIEGRIVESGVDLGEVGGVNGLFRVTEPGDGTDADQRAFPPGTADRSQQRANGGSTDGNDDAQPPASLSTNGPIASAMIAPPTATQVASSACSTSLQPK